MVKERSDEQIITSLVQLCIEKQPLFYTNCANYRVCFQWKTEQRHYVDADFDERFCQLSRVRLSLSDVNYES